MTLVYIIVLLVGQTVKPMIYRPINNVMRTINTFHDWKSDRMNEEVSVLALQIGVILGILGWKGLKALINKIARNIGEKTKNEEMTKEDLKELVDGTIKRIEKLNLSDVSLGEVRSSIKKKIDDEEIKTADDIVQYFKKYV
jgi:hypothetical protein